MGGTKGAKAAPSGAASGGQGKQQGGFYGQHLNKSAAGQLGGIFGEGASLWCSSNSGKPPNLLHNNSLHLLMFTDVRSNNPFI